jgi:D-psicose/D-tagatose/L-ribulose 3-epimerase
VPWNAVADVLKKVNYGGALVIESFTTTVKEIARAAAFWRRVAPNRGMPATEGLTFLKKLMA